MKKTMIAGLALMTVASPAAAEIKIGLTGALTGPVAGTYAPAVEGLRLYIEGVNAAGGINGEPIELILQDDGAEPSRAAVNAKRFLTQDGVVMMVNASLSSTYAPTIAEAQRAEVPLIFAAAACLSGSRSTRGSSSRRNPPLSSRNHLAMESLTARSKQARVPAESSARGTPSLPVPAAFRRSSESPS